MKTLLKYLNPVSRKIGLGIFIKVIGTLVELLLPAILSHVLKVVVARKSLQDILLWGGIMILCATLAVIFNITANRQHTGFIAFRCFYVKAHNKFQSIFSC